MPKASFGVEKKILREGVKNSSPKKGERIAVHYTGTLSSGQKFDCSRERGKNLRTGPRGVKIIIFVFISIKKLFFGQGIIINIIRNNSEGDFEKKSSK